MPEYEMIYGAKVKTPIDMPDNILKDCIAFSLNALKDVPADDDDQIQQIIQQIKEHMDENWEPTWHVVSGRNFGSLVTHQAARFVYFYVNDR
jgi:dynein light chain LC8-type